MEELKDKLKDCYCILCREPIVFNFYNPYCDLCSNSCSSFNRASSSVMPAYFCHKCGEEDYISDEKPFCDDCKNKLKI